MEQVTTFSYERPAEVLESDDKYLEYFKGLYSNAQRLRYYALLQAQYRYYYEAQHGARYFSAARKGYDSIVRRIENKLGHIAINPLNELSDDREEITLYEHVENIINMPHFFYLIDIKRLGRDEKNRLKCKLVVDRLNSSCIPIFAGGEFDEKEIKTPSFLDVMESQIPELQPIEHN
jgi:hypothetical protein